jgi:hypothetical protein
MPVLLGWRYTRPGVGDYKCQTVASNGRSQHNPSALAMPEQAHRVGVGLGLAT